MVSHGTENSLIQLDWRLVSPRESALYSLPTAGTVAVCPSLVSGEIQTQVLALTQQSTLLTEMSPQPQKDPH